MGWCASLLTHSPPLFHSKVRACLNLGAVNGQFSHSQSGEEEVKEGRIQPPDDYERTGCYYQVRSHS